MIDACSMNICFPVSGTGGMKYQEYHYSPNGLLVVGPEYKPKGIMTFSRLKIDGSGYDPAKVQSNGSHARVLLSSCSRVKNICMLGINQSCSQTVLIY